MIGPLILLAAAAGTAAAEEPVLDCENAMTQQDMNRCAYQDYLAADAELNRIWPQAVREMKWYDDELKQDGYDDGRPGFFETLLTAQRAWLTYRDSHCANEGFLARGGSLDEFLEITCKTHLTKLRTQELRGLVEFPE